MCLDGKKLKMLLNMGCWVFVEKIKVWYIIYDAYKFFYGQVLFRFLCKNYKTRPSLKKYDFKEILNSCYLPEVFPPDF